MANGKKRTTKLLQEAHICPSIPTIKPLSTTFNLISFVSSNSCHDIVGSNVSRSRQKKTPPTLRTTPYLLGFTIPHLRMSSITTQNAHCDCITTHIGWYDTHKRKTRVEFSSFVQWGSQPTSLPPRCTLQVEFCRHRIRPKSIGWSWRKQYRCYPTCDMVSASIQEHHQEEETLSVGKVTRRK